MALGLLSLPAVWFLFFILLLVPVNLEAREPSLSEVQSETLKVLGFDRREMDGWRKRSRWAAALPRLQVGFDRDVHDVASLTTKDSVSITGGNVLVGPSENNFDQDLNQATGFNAKAVWFLDELLFNHDALAISAERRDWARDKTRALQEVTEAYLVRKRILKEGSQGLSHEKDRSYLDRAMATLDAQTEGWFSKTLEEGP